MTFLSGRVYFLFKELSETQDVFHSSTLLPSLLFDWYQINLAFGDDCEGSIFNKSEDWFNAKIPICWSILNNAGKVIRGTPLHLMTELAQLSDWCCQPPELINMLNSNEENPAVNALEVILKITSYLERGLGNIFLLKGQTIPFLLKDLIQTGEIYSILGTEVVFLMQLMFGCVSGLNIRNVAWHGFISEKEINPNLLPAIIVLTSSIGHILKEKSLIVVKRPLVTTKEMQIHSKELTNYFPADINISLEQVLRDTAYVDRKQHCFWIQALSKYKSERYGDTVLILLPLIENILRGIFCQLNECDNKLLFARCDTFYIIMDDMLAPTFEEKENRLIKKLGEPLFGMLLDLFFYINGPRVRDRLSHGEVSLDSITKVLATHVFGIVLAIIQTDLKVKEQSEKNSFNYWSFVNSTPYDIKFHISSICKRSLIELFKNISEIDGLPKPVSFRELSVNDKLLEELTLESADLFKLDPLTILIELKEEIRTVKPKTLFRPKAVLELYSSVNRITSKLHVTVKNLIKSAEDKYTEWLLKKMRSRTRVNYSKMWMWIPAFRIFTIIILGCITKLFCGLSQEKKELDFLSSQKFTKLIEQIADSILSMTSPERNQWDEARNLIIEQKKEIMKWKFLIL